MTTASAPITDGSPAKIHTKRQLRLADLLDGMPHHTVAEPNEEGFNLGVWWEPTCTSVGCIGGWTIQLMQQDGLSVGNRTKQQAAMSYLGLTHKQGSALFFPGEEELPLNYLDVDADHAAAVVRHLTETGQVDWYRYIEISQDATVRRAAAESQGLRTF